MLRAIILVAFVVSASAQAHAHFLPAQSLLLASSDQQTVDAKRETCWRTNRSTGQRFRIC